MMDIKLKKISLFILFTSCFLFQASSVQAVCPVCTVAVGACVGLSRYFRIDDMITGLWIGGLAISMIIWTINWMARKNFNFKGYKLLAIFFYSVLIIAPLYYKGIIGHPLNKIWGIDKLIAGIIAGALFFWLATVLNSWMKRKNGDRVYFPFQKVVIPLVALGILSVIFYFITC